MTNTWVPYDREIKRKTESDLVQHEYIFVGPYLVNHHCKSY